MNCKDVWAAIEAIKSKVTEEEYKRLCDAFTDFECSWEEHAVEFHSEGE